MGDARTEEVGEKRKETRKSKEAQMHLSQPELLSSFISVDTEEDWYLNTKRLTPLSPYRVCHAKWPSIFIPMFGMTEIPIAPASGFVKPI